MKMAKPAALYKVHCQSTASHHGLLQVSNMAQTVRLLQCGAMRTNIGQGGPRLLPQKAPGFIAENPKLRVFSSLGQSRTEEGLIVITLQVLDWLFGLSEWC